MLSITCGEKIREFPATTVLLLMSQTSKISATMVYKALAVCVFRKDEFYLRQVGKDHKDGKRRGIPDEREN